MILILVGSMERIMVIRLRSLAVDLELIKNKSGYDCGGSRSIRKGTDLGVEDFGCGKSSFGDEEVDCLI